MYSLDFLIFFVFGWLSINVISGEHVFAPGHKKKFGNGKQSMKPIQEVEGFAKPEDFFKNYVLTSTPLKMKNAAKSYPAFSLWNNDEYFLKLNVPSDNTVLVETKKKENRKQETLDMHFHEFIKSYQSTERYMVQPVPPFLIQDVLLPGCLQCEYIYRHNLVESIMWFSSGGTKSVVHTDSVDNINCLIDGDKEFVMVDPALYGDKVDLDHPEGAYSDIDVDSVDYNKYPGLADVEYNLVNLTAGDCLYIPYKWIHQVRSHNRNIAVNVWWNNANNKDIDYSTCNKDIDNTLTLDKVQFVGFNTIEQTPEEIKLFMKEIVRHNPGMNADEMLELIIGDSGIEELDPEKTFAEPLFQLFSIMDKNNNGGIDDGELDDLSEQAWSDIRELMVEFEENVDSLSQQFEGEDGGGWGPSEDYEDPEFPRDEL